MQFIGLLRGQYSSDTSILQASRDYGSSNLPTQPRNHLRHGLTKLNSSVSFGINESAIAAIFRDVAYGLTRSYPQENNLSTAAPTTTTSTSTTTTTTSTTTTKAPEKTSPATPIAALDINNQDRRLSFEKHVPESNPYPSVWDGVSQGQPSHMEHETDVNSYERPNVPTPHNRQQYPGPYEQLSKNTLSENYNTERDHQSIEGLYMRSNAENNGNQQKYNDNSVHMNDITKEEVVDYAWVIHVYLTGVLMGVVAAMAICCISRIHYCSPIFPRKFFITMHILVFLAAFLRCVLLFNGSFGETHSKLPKVLTGLLINSVPPFLTAAFALVLLVFLKATHLYFLPMKYQSSLVLAVISVVHIISSVIVDICAGLSESESIINALRAGVQALTAGWEILLCLGFMFLIAHLLKNEEMRAVIPKKSLQVIYVSVAFQLILACFTIYGIIIPRAIKNKENDNTWSLWALASVERLLEACFCVTLLAITTTFSLSKCNTVKQQEQKVFSVMSTGKRDGLGRSANVYPVTSDKRGFLANGLFSANLDPENATKSENIYSGWMEKYAGTIDSTTSDFQLINGKGTSTMSTVLYPPFNTIGGGDSGDDSAKDSYITNGQESSATSYSTLSSYRQMNPGHLCYCAPVAACCPTGQGFPSLSKQPVLLVSQYSHPQVTNCVPQSEESSSGSSYYGSSLGSSNIYSSPQYYTCSTQLGEINEAQLASRQIPMHLHQCSEINTARAASGDDTHHIPSASLPILQDIPENNQRILQYRPQQPLPQHEMQRITNVNGITIISNPQTRTPIATAQQHHHHSVHHPHPHIHPHLTFISL